MTSEERKERFRKSILARQEYIASGKNNEPPQFLSFLTIEDLENYHDDNIDCNPRACYTDEVLKKKGGYESRCCVCGNAFVGSKMNEEVCRICYEGDY